MAAAVGVARARSPEGESGQVGTARHEGRVRAFGGSRGERYHVTLRMARGDAGRGGRARQLGAGGRDARFI